MSKSIEELQQPTRENVAYIIDAMNKKLQVVNTGAIRPEGFDLTYYEDLLDLYAYTLKKDTYSMSEMESIVSELGKIRKK